jgi:leucyl aminopeptidase (aminopeptidase T)
MRPAEAARNALEYVLEAKNNERLVIFCDDVRADVGDAFYEGAQDLKLETSLVMLKTSEGVFRNQLPVEHQRFLTTQRPGIYINLLRGNREETPFRIGIIHSETSDHKTRLGHCPGITMDMLTEGALALTAGEHRGMQAFAGRLMKDLENTTEIEVTNPAGTNLAFHTDNRAFFTDTKIDWKTMKWMNLPTGEVIVAPVETSLRGTLVCDMAIGGIGKLGSPFIIDVEYGAVKNAFSKDTSAQMRVAESLATDNMARVVGEFAFGINPKARFVEEFLESEKIKGTIHIAFGDNLDFPSGQNNSANHMDFLISNPTVRIRKRNSNVVEVLSAGVFQS